MKQETESLFKEELDKEKKLHDINIRQVDGSG